MKKKIIFILGFGILLLVAFVNSVIAANFPMDVIQPKQGFDNLNRFHRAYPGLEYSVRVAVIGGMFPFKYYLDSGPAGMTVSGNMGEITWTPADTGNRIESGVLRGGDGEGVGAG